MGASQPYLRMPYRVGRQQHLGDFLDYLRDDLGSVSSWHLEHDGSAAVWVIAEGGRQPRRYSTKEAEAVAGDIADRAYVYWRPVPSPGGEDLYRTVRRQIANRRRKLSQEPLTHGPDLPGERWDQT